MTAETASAAKVEREPLSFEFSCDGPVWKGVPVVGGHKILSASRIDVSLDASGFPQVTMRLNVADSLKLGLSTAAVLLDDGTCDALVALGWTPPADDG
jgi:hypothetical protein